MRTRVVTALAGAPLVLAAALVSGGSWPFPGWPFALFTALLVSVGLREIYDGARHAGLTPRDLVGTAAALGFVLAAIPATRGEGEATLLAALSLLLMGGMAGEALRTDRTPLRSQPVTWFGALYVGGLAAMGLRLRLEGETLLAAVPWVPVSSLAAAAGKGGWLVLLTFLCTSAADTFALFTGKAFGRHRLAPEVSPGKTWEGVLGGAAGAAVIGTAAAAAIGFPPLLGLAAGLLVAVVGPLGDLAKSAIKREIGIKDFGTVLPGHGGVLDRFDSYLFAAPTVYWLARCWPG
jgi:phosphatidate cytidylyltransferase